MSDMPDLFGLPIHTAPKDGTEIMLCNPKGYWHRGVWYPAWHQSVWGIPATDGHTWRCASGSGAWDEPNATHWKPINEY